MSKIEFFALGGLDEHGKDCYALTINGDIYIINCGIVTPPSVSLGVKKIIPDFL
jgi:ribonuclease J